MEMRRIGLDRLRPGEYGILCAYAADAAQTRLEELGLLPGTRIRCLCRAPHLTPAAYEIDGAVFALRRADAAKLFVEAVR